MDKTLYYNTNGGLRMKLKSLTLLVILGAVFVFSSCKQPEQAGGKSNGPDLVIWESYNDEEHAVFTTIVDSFSKKTGLKVKVQRIPFDGMEQKLLTAIATKNVPDLARVDYAFTAVLASKNGVFPIKDPSLDPIIAELSVAALYGNYYKGQLWGLPDQTTCIALFYNKDLFDKAGIKAPPKTWDEFISVAQKLTNPKKQIWGFAMRNTLWWTFPFFFTYGGKFLSEDGRKCLLDSPEAIKGFTLKVDLYRKYKVEAGAWQSGAIPPDAGFRNGKYAMIFDGPWSIKSLNELGLNYGVALIPAGPAGSATSIGGTNMVIPVGAKHKENAIKFLKYLLSAETQAFWANQLGQIPVNMEALPMIDTTKHPYLPVFIKQMKYARPRPPVPNYGDFERIFNPEMEAALKGLKTPAEALKAATERVNREVLGSQ